jgi:hypothetical protein
MTGQKEIAEARLGLHRAVFADSINHYGDTARQWCGKFRSFATHASFIIRVIFSGE